MTYTVGSLCSGYGGLDRAVEAAIGPHRLAWYAEFDDAPASVMAHHWPDVPNLRDLTKIDWATVEPVDVLTAGYPCQPFSLAGHRKGTDDPRHLWPYIAAAVRVLRPRLVVLENVSGHLGLGFDSVLADLATLRFDAEWSVVRASDVGACHRRARLFVVAAPADAGGPGRRQIAGGSHGDEARDARRSSSDDHVARGAGPRWLPTADRTEAPADPSGRGWLARTGLRGGDQAGHRRRLAYDDGGEAPADTDGQGSQGRRPALPVGRPVSADVPAPDAHGNGREGQRRSVLPRVDPQRDVDRRRDGAGLEAWGPYAAAIERHAQLVRRPAPPAVDDRGRLNPRFVEWMMTLPDGHVTDVLPTRTKALKALGNGVVPLQAAYAIAGLMERLYQQ